LLNISKDRVVAGVLLVRYQLYNFKKLIDRNPLEITWQPKSSNLQEEGECV